jgi:multiple sugar transport system permease protein
MDRDREAWMTLTALPTALAPTGPSPAPAPGRRRARRRGTAGWIFSAPGLLLLLAFLVLPFVLALLLSFTNERMGSPLPTRWIGWENYRRTFTDGEFWQALGNNVIFTLVIVPVQTSIALFLAVLANQQLRGIKLFRAIFFSPIVTGLTVAATIWFLLYDPDSGLINGLLRAISGGALESDWLQSPRMALVAVMIMSVWSSAGFQMIILLAALQEVPQELYEASALDGASGWQQFRHVTLPGLRNPLIFLGTVTTIYAFRLFDQVYVMTNGGPEGHTNTLLLQMISVGFERQSIGRGSAIAVIFFVIVLAITVVQRLAVREDRE